MLDTLVVIAIVAALAPIVGDLPARIRLPVVVVEVVLGILVGPDVLGLAKQGTIVDFLSTLGLAFLFFLAGVEIEFERVRGRPARLGVLGWLVSIALGLSIGALLEAIGFILDWDLVGFALCTTALGTLMPILRDEGELETRFGSFVVGIGTCGEFGPILAVSLFFGAHRTAASALLLVAFAAIALGAALVAMRARPSRITRLIAETMETSAHLAVRLSLLALIVLVYFAEKFGLDLILGAFAAGVVVGLVAHSEQAEPLRVKLEGIGYGFVIPIFFVVSGISFDVDALFESATTILRLPAFLGLFLFVRGLPVILFYRRDLPRELAPLALYSATALPLVIAITQIGLDTGRMRPANAAALVGAGMVSVFAFPLTALTLRRRQPREVPAGESAASA